MVDLVDVPIDEASPLVTKKVPAQLREWTLIWYGDGPDVTGGFGEVAEQKLLGLMRKGWKVVNAFGINSPGLPDKKYPFPIYSAMHLDGSGVYDYCGRSRFLSHLDRSPSFDVCLMLQDTFQFSQDLQIPAPWSDWFEGFEDADALVTYTEWGRRQVELVAARLEGKVQVIPHGCDPRFFGAEPNPEDPSRSDLRMKLLPRLADRFLVLWVGANQRRKRLPLLFQAFHHLVRKLRVPATLVLRTQVVNPEIGWNLRRLGALYELTPDELVFIERSIPKAGLRDLYRICDVYCHLAHEGWGLPVTEAMAAGLPCVLAKHSSLQEIGAEDRAYLVNCPDYEILPSDYEVARWEPRPKEVAWALNYFRRCPEIAAQYAERARTWSKARTWDLAVDRWDELLRAVVTSSPA